MQPKCEHCETEGAKPSRFGSLLCSDCIQGLESLETERRKEEREQIKRLVEGKGFEPSLAFVMYANRLKRLIAFGGLNEDKVLDCLNKDLIPLIHLMPDEEVGRTFAVTKELYFYLQSALGMRKVDRFREAEVIKRKTKVDKTRAKATEEIARQKKHASKDRTLSKEERAKAKVVEGLAMALGCSLEEAEKHYKKMSEK